MRLPGGMEVPLGFCVETYRRASVRAVPVDRDSAEAMLQSRADRLLAETMVAGRVTSEQSDLRSDAGALVLIKTVHCREMIARSAEIPILELEQYGETDQRGTDGTAH